MDSYSRTFVSPSWLEAHLADPQLAIIDVRAGFRPQPPGPSDFFSMRTDYDEAHIPGAHYLHMVDDLSDPAGPFGPSCPILLQPGLPTPLRRFPACPATSSPSMHPPAK